MGDGINRQARYYGAKLKGSFLSVEKSGLSPWQAGGSGPAMGGLPLLCGDAFLAGTRISMRHRPAVTSRLPFQGRF